MRPKEPNEPVVPTVPDVPVVPRVPAIPLEDVVPVNPVDGLPIGGKSGPPKCPVVAGGARVGLVIGGFNAALERGD